MKNYRLAVDENGSPFVLNSKGSIDFGYITEEMNLPPAPNNPTRYKRYFSVGGSQ